MHISVISIHLHKLGSLKVRQSQREHKITLGNPLGVENPAETSLDILQQSTIPVQDFLTNKLELRVLKQNLCFRTYELH